MVKIVISFTTEKDNVDEQFKGVITFKSEEGEEISFRYTWKSPDECENSVDINITFSNESENFNINKKFFIEQYKKLTERQQIVLGLSMMILPDMIDQVKILKTSTSDTIHQEIEEKPYRIIFNK